MGYIKNVNLPVNIYRRTIFSEQMQQLKSYIILP